MRRDDSRFVTMSSLSAKFKNDVFLYPVEPVYRGQRRGNAGLVFLLCYACDKLGVQKESFVARIGTANMHSILLFRALGSGFSALLP